jgi:hypothetical protein
MLRVNANAQGILDNVADVGPVVPPDSPTVPPGTGVPDLPSGPVVPATAIKAVVVKRVASVVRVLAKKAVAPTPPPPAVTG